MCQDPRSSGVAHVRERFLAALVVTDMRLLAGVSPHMNGQGISLGKTLVTIFKGAMVGPLIGVYPIMAAETRLANERLIDRQLDLVGGR